MLGRAGLFQAHGCAHAEPDGLLAAGGDLSPARLLAAYRRGIFPWFSQPGPILWWSPARRTVFDTANVHVARRLARWLRQCRWTITADHAFGEVVRACAAPRGDDGTWTTPEMIAAYERLHALGHAHSVAVREDGRLVGGIYGVALGRMFYGESMFSAATNGSKVALLALCRALDEWRFPLLDAQVASNHLASLGAFEMPRPEFCARAAALAAEPGVEGSWAARFPLVRASGLAC